MDQLANEFLKMGLLGAKGQSDETGHSLAMIQRFAEAVSLDQERAAACQHFVRIIIEETCFENCSILFWNQLTSKLSLVAAYGLDDQLEVASRRYRQNLRFGSAMLRQRHAAELRHRSVRDFARLGRRNGVLILFAGHKQGRGEDGE